MYKYITNNLEISSDEENSNEEYYNEEIYSEKNSYKENYVEEFIQHRNRVIFKGETLTVFFFEGPILKM